VANLPVATRVELRIPPDRVGVVVRDVLGADPGVDALEEGDLVVEINRKPTPDLASYRRVLGGLDPGAPAWLFVFRPRPQQTFLTRVYVDRRP
jgi:S1-C subfamily serine protease